MDGGTDFRSRVDDVRAKLAIGGVVEEHVKLSGSSTARSRRGRCPFHNGNSASFSLKDPGAADGFGHCFGCGWHGHVVDFVKDIYGLSFPDALAECERMAGIRREELRYSQARPVSRQRNPDKPRRRALNLIEPIEMGRALWRKAATNGAAVRRYFIGRGVPERVLSDERLSEFRYLAECPCVRWDIDTVKAWAWPETLPIAPAIMALVKVPTLSESGLLEFIPTGLHVTYLNPAGDGTMIRRKPWAKADDPEPMLPKRRMLGGVSRGCVLLGRYRPDVHLWIGEGNETVLSAMALGHADREAVGIATLSLDNLQGQPRKYGHGIWPLHRIEPDPARPPAFQIPRHKGPVTGLVDSDMSPLKGMTDPKTGAPRGEAVVERKGGPIVQRDITGAERARICAELFVKVWRNVGARPVDVVRAPVGMDFNDAARAQVASGDSAERAPRAQVASGDSAKRSAA